MTHGKHPELWPARHRGWTPSGVPLTRFLQNCHHTHQITGCDTANRPTTIGGVEHFPLGPQEKLARLDNAAAFVPASPNPVGIPWHRKTIAHGKGQMELRNGLLGLFQGVSRERHDRHVKRVERIEMGLIVS
jgi:hypothetical protein